MGGCAKAVGGGAMAIGGGARVATVGMGVEAEIKKSSYHSTI